MVARIKVFLTNTNSPNDKIQEAKAPHRGIGEMSPNTINIPKQSQTITSIIACCLMEVSWSQRSNTDAFCNYSSLQRNNFPIKLQSYFIYNN